MALGYYPQEDEYFLTDGDELAIADDFWYEEDPQESNRSLDGITLVALALVLLVAVQMILDKAGRTTVIEEALPAPLPAEQAEPAEESSPISPPLPEPVPADPSFVASPYDSYVLTQGVHGASYGHMAIDIAAGKGVTIKSPINGVVSELYIDVYGNPTLVIENERYQVTMLHGDYTATVGQELKAGDVVGAESNHGYTVDWQGRLCAGRDCGYHTHLNIFDKQIGSNVNPLGLLGG